jgi:hypothetical protein
MTNQNPIDAILGIRQGPKARSVGQGIPITAPPGLTITTKAQVRAAGRINSAREALPDIPSAGQSFHAIMAGTYATMDLLEVVLERAARPGAVLWVSTLGYNRDSADRLIRLLDAGTLAVVQMLVSDFFESTNPDEADAIDALQRILPLRGGTYCAARTHAKVACLEFPDGRKLVLETSANLRSCRSIEQVSLFHDATLHDYHRAWMDALREEERKRAHEKTRPSRR